MKTPVASPEKRLIVVTKNYTITGQPQCTLAVTSGQLSGNIENGQITPPPATGYNYNTCNCMTIEAKKFSTPETCFSFCWQCQRCAV